MIVTSTYLLLEIHGLSNAWPVKSLALKISVSTEVVKNDAFSVTFRTICTLAKWIANVNKQLFTGLGSKLCSAAWVQVLITQALYLQVDIYKPQRIRLNTKATSA